KASSSRAMLSTSRSSISRLSDRTSSVLRSRRSERIARRRVSISAVPSVFIGEIPHFPRADILVAEPTVDVDHLPGDVGGALRGQERDQLRYFVRLAVPLVGRAREDLLVDGVEHLGGVCFRYGS